jgi:hypothetical protein
MTAHGFRATASSILHVDGNTVRRAYARAEFWDERVRMMQWWADRLDESNEVPRRPLPRVALSVGLTGRRLRQFTSNLREPIVRSPI